MPAISAFEGVAAMAEETENATEQVQTKRSPGGLLAVGIPATLFTAMFAGRMIWEETWLTFHEGPQMLGYSLAHGGGAILLVTPFLLALWLLAAIITMAVYLWRRKALSRLYWSTLAGAVLTIGLVFIPPEFWQWAFARSFAKSPHAADLMVYAGEEGGTRTVRGYLDHGVPLTATNYEGSTAVFGAAAGGRLPTVEMLASRGADINATNSYGDSPLEAAAENGHTDVAAFLKAHGASQIRGTPGQREAATTAIVRTEIERENSR
jgi:hypothetical protein